MKVIGRNQFINSTGQKFTLPFVDLYEDGNAYGICAIVEFKSKVIISFSTPDKHNAEYRSVICFDRKNAQVLWQIDPIFIWEVPGNRNIYVDEEIEYGTVYSASGLDAYYKSIDGHFWIEECFNKDRTKKIWGLEKKAFVAHYPAYQNDKKYKIKESDYYFIHKDTHELVLENILLPFDNRENVDGAVWYTNITDVDEKDCLLSITSNYNAFVFEVDIQTGKVKPAYANIAEDK